MDAMYKHFLWFLIWCKDLRVTVKSRHKFVVPIRNIDWENWLHKTPAARGCHITALSKTERKPFTGLNHRPVPHSGNRNGITAKPSVLESLRRAWYVQYLICLNVRWPIITAKSRRWRQPITKGPAGKPQTNQVLNLHGNSCLKAPAEPIGAQSDTGLLEFNGLFLLLIKADSLCYIVACHFQWTA